MRESHPVSAQQQVPRESWILEWATLDSPSAQQARGDFTKATTRYYKETAHDVLYDVLYDTLERDGRDGATREANSLLSKLL